MKPLVLSLDCPKLRAAMTDIALMQRWEVLRRSGKPLTVHELAEACGVSDAVAQKSLDILVEGGFAVRLRANARCRSITYRSISDRVIVEWDSGSDAHVGFLMQNRQAMRAYSRIVIDRNDTPDTRGMPGQPKFRGHQSYTLTREEAETIAQTLRQAWEAITQIEIQARARAAARAAAPDRGRPTASDAPHGREEAYHVALEFRPLQNPELPIADIGTCERKTVARELAYLSTAPAAVLTQREREIAERLTAGASRPEVAQELGVTLNTIASATKRIYAKLGVRSRAEFVSRMKGA